MMNLGKRVTLIAAVADNGVIGRDGQLPWRLSGDLRHFKEMTLGRAVVMGRKTFESIGKPLPDRANIVVSRQPGLGASIAKELTPNAATVVVVDCLEAALLLADQGSFPECKRPDEIMVIGGSEIYAAALPYATSLLITHVHAEPQGDAFFPEISGDVWRLGYESACAADNGEPAYTIGRYERA